MQMFFGLLSLVLIGVKFKSDKRDRFLQHGGWPVKVGLWLGFNVLAFLAPVGLVTSYCKYLNLVDFGHMMLGDLLVCVRPVNNFLNLRDRFLLMHLAQGPSSDIHISAFPNSATSYPSNSIMMHCGYFPSLSNDM